MINYVLGFAFDKDKSKVALIRKNRPEWQKGFLNGIGGKIEDTDKSPVKAMIREFKEETSYPTDINDWQNYFLMTFDNGDSNCYCFRMFNCELDKLQSKTDEQVILVDIDRMQFTKVISNLKWLIPLALDNEFLKFGELNYK